MRNDTQGKYHLRQLVEALAVKLQALRGDITLETVFQALVAAADQLSVNLNWVELELAGQERKRTPIPAPERQRLQSLYPFFAFTFTDGGGEAVTPKGSRILFGNDVHNYEATLNREHMEVAVARRLQDRYPHLWVSATTDRAGVFLSLWQKRTLDDGTETDGTALRHDHPQVEDPELHAKLAALEAEAANASQEGWFYCTGHARAEQVHEGMYHYFAGRFCRAYGEEHPEHLRSALAETYE